MRLRVKLKRLDSNVTKMEKLKWKRMRVWDYRRGKRRLWRKSSSNNSMCWRIIMLLRICSCWISQAKAQTLKITLKSNSSIMEVSLIKKMPPEHHNLKTPTLSSCHNCKAPFRKINTTQNSNNKNKLNKHQKLILIIHNHSNKLMKIPKLNHINSKTNNNQLSINGRRLTTRMKITKKPKANRYNNKLQHSPKSTKKIQPKK